MEAFEEEIKGVKVISVEGSIRANDNQKFDELLRELKEKVDDTLVLDLSKAKYLNSRAVGSIVSLWMALGEQRNRVILVRPAVLIERLLDSVGVYTLMDVRDTVDEAVDELARGRE